MCDKTEGKEMGFFDIIQADFAVFWRVSSSAYLAWISVCTGQVNFSVTKIKAVYGMISVCLGFL